MYFIHSNLCVFFFSPICMSLYYYYFFLYCTDKILKWCWMWVCLGRMGKHSAWQGESIQPFIINCEVSCRYFRDALYHTEQILYCSLFAKRMLNLVKYLFQHLLRWWHSFLLYSVDVVNYIFYYRMLNEAYIFLWCITIGLSLLIFCWGLLLLFYEGHSLVFSSLLVIVLSDLGIRVTALLND